MIIKFNGSQSLAQLGLNLQKIVTDVVNRAGLDVNYEDIRYRDVEVGVTFNVNGESQFLSVVHDDLEEVFKVYVQLDENGEVDFKKDNEKETFMDNYTRAVAKGEEPVYKEIESVYDDEELIHTETIDGGDIQEMIYTHKPTGHVVVRYYKNDVLVGEVAYSKEEVQ